MQNWMHIMIPCKWTKNKNRKKKKTHTHKQKNVGSSVKILGNFFCFSNLL